MTITLDLFCFTVPFTMLVSAVFSIVTAVGGCGRPIYARAILTDVAFLQFSKNPLNYFTWMMPWYFSLYRILHALVHILGQLIVSVCWILVLGKISTCSFSWFWFWYVDWILIYAENNSSSYVFCYCIWMCCAIIKKIGLSVIWSVLMVLSVPPPVILVSLTFWGIWL